MLVALAWDSHVHHVPARRWFAADGPGGWETCTLTESGFVRVSSNRLALPSPVGVGGALRVLVALRGRPGHRFLATDVSPADPDVPAVTGHRRVTDAILLTLARRHSVPLVTFDRGLARLARDQGVELLGP